MPMIPLTAVLPNHQVFLPDPVFVAGDRFLSVAVFYTYIHICSFLI